MKKLLVGLGITICFVFASSFSAEACHFDNIVVEADCEGFSITGQYCASAEWHPIGTIEYLFTVDYDGQIIEVSGAVNVNTTPEWSCENGFTVSHSWGELCGESIIINGVVDLLSSGYLHDTITLEPPIELICPCDVGCNRTPGYWKTHPEAWPVEEITIGGVTYSKEDAIALMEMPVAKDKTYTMFDALVAAKLNVVVGSDVSCVAGIISAAEDWMAAYGPVGAGVGAGGKNSPWREGEPFYGILDQYNNGELCVPHCD